MRYTDLKSPRLRRWILLLAAGLLASNAAVAKDCWKGHLEAQQEFRDGFASYLDGDKARNKQEKLRLFEEAIEGLTKAKGDRRDPDGNCPVQTGGRNAGEKAYYLPYFYLGVASFKKRQLEGDVALACDDAEVYFGMAMRWRRETFYKWESRFEDHLEELEAISEDCGFGLAGGDEDVVAAQSSAPGSVRGGRQ